MTSSESGAGAGPAGDCPSESRLRALLDPVPPGDDDDAAIAAHLEACESCRRRLDDMAAGQGVSEVLAGAKGDAPAADDTAVLSAAMEALRCDPSPAPRESAPDPVAEAEPLDFLEAGAPAGYLGKLGAYHIIGVVGRGGMGIVLKAHDPSLDRIVAIKVLAPALAACAASRRRFVREARAAAAVSHEHVVTIHAVDEGGAGGTRLPFLVMQFVSGRSLEARLRATGPLKLEEILRIGMQAAAGLAAAHAQGLVHRDIKPANIMLENGVERVKLTDFGLARAADDADVTLTGHVTGTPHYMSPEHARGERVDPRSDLFSLGGVLYALCTGRPPFGGSSPLSTLRKVCEEEPVPVREVNGEIPQWLAEFVASLMRKDPAARPASAAAVAEHLERQLARLQHPAGHREGHDRNAVRRVVRPAYALIAGVMAVIAVAAVLAIRSPVVREWFGSRPVAVDAGPPATIPSALAPAARPRAATLPTFTLTDAGDAGRQFATLADAVSAAPAGATIEIAHDGRLELPPLDLGGKPLRIRAAKGSRPVLVQSPRFEPILTTPGPLVLEGLEFQAAPGRPDRFPAGEEWGPCLVQVSRGPLYVTHCRFAVRGVPRLRAGCIRVIDSATCEIRDSELYSLRGIAVQWMTTPDHAALKLDDVVVAARMAVVVHKPAKRTASVAVNRSTLYSGGLITAHPSYEPAGLSVDLADNVLVIGAILFDPEAERMPGRLDDVPVAVRQTVLERIVSSEFDAAVAARPAAATSEPDDPPTSGPATAPAGKTNLEGLLEARVQFTGELRAKASRAEMPTRGDFEVQSIRVPGRGPVPPRRLSSIGAGVERLGPGGPFDDFRATQGYAQWQRRTGVAPGK